MQDKCGVIEKMGKCMSACVFLFASAKIEVSAVLQNILCYLWLLFSGAWNDSQKAAHKWAITSRVAVVTGAEIAAAPAIAPLFQERGLRGVKTHYKSYKALDWKRFSLTTGPDAPAERIEADVYQNYLCRVCACRLILVPDNCLITRHRSVPLHWPGCLRGAGRRG